MSASPISATPSEAAGPVRDVLLFPKLSDYDIACLVQVGQTLGLKPGDAVFREGDPDVNFVAVLEGGLRITKRIGMGEQFITVHHEGEFAGEMSLLTGGKAMATGRAVGEARVVKLTASQFRTAMLQFPEVGERILPVLARRNFQLTALLQQQEKLAALGRLSAGLAHELNNPAAAAARAVGTLRNSFNQMREKTFAINAFALGGDGASCVRSHATGAMEQAAQAEDLAPLERSDREQEVGDWLDDHGFENAWNLAPSLVSAGYTTQGLDDFASGVSAPMVTKALSWVAASIETELLLGELERSVARISELVKSVKSYSFMDQAPFQETDLRQGLKDTVTMLSNKVKQFALVKEFDPDLPPVCCFPAELNQVWTNLIDNACDAMGAGGTLTIRTARDGELARIEIGDTGPGIPEAIQSKVFEAFFTTKPQGQGTGLGLDIAYRIITVRHRGSMTFHTSPAGTTFVIRLPINQAEPGLEVQP